MDISLIITLLLLLLFASALYYYFFKKRVPDVFYLGKSSLVIIMFMIVPLLATVLYYQAGAEDRLNAIGFTPHSSFTSSVGIATGTGESPTWLFETDSSKETIIDFYKKEQTHRGWEQIEEDHPKWRLELDTRIYISFRKNNNIMRLLASDNMAGFILSIENK